jgi:5'(3')-deoxyribonucleotidase
MHGSDTLRSFSSSRRRLAPLARGRASDTFAVRDRFMKTIAVDLDDVLNDFTETLQRTQFFREELHALSEEVFQDYLAKVRSGSTESSGLLSTDYSFFRCKIHQRCYECAQARTDGVNFMKWLRQNRWRIVICTYRDLRRTQDSTRKWLGENEIPFDYLFMTKTKIAFCKAWGIEHLIDDEATNIALGKRFGVHVYYPATKRPPAPPANPVQTTCAARPFQSFDEIKSWIEG